jgi:MoxR-like ATPase
MLQFVTGQLGLPLFQIEGSADLTPSKLIGTFNPNLVLEQGFKSDFFEPGPLFRAMEEGGILYIDELNRAAPDATNALIRAMEEREIVIPRYGRVIAKPSFRVVAAMNPFDDTGVTRISRALFDRMCRLKMDYQSLEEESQIVTEEVPETPQAIIGLGTRITRATRYDDRLRQGASVRGAIDFARIAPSLALVRGGYGTETLIDAALTSFTGKIWLDTPGISAEEIMLDIVQQVLRDLDKGFFDSLNADLKKKMTKI